MDSAEMKRLRDSFRKDPEEGSTPPPGDSPSSRQPPTDAKRRSERPPSRKTVSWEPEARTGTRRRRSMRPPVTVDEVGNTAMKIARGARRESAPKLLASRSAIGKAPIDTRAAFLLSLIDGRNTVESLVDMSGMRADEVQAILDRLARLGLISLPE